MPKPKPKPHQTKSFIKQVLEKRPSATEMPDGLFVVSFLHLDQEQGDTWKDWEGKTKLALALETLTGYCKSTLKSQVNTGKFDIYTDFPPKERTEFTHPRYVPEDAEWARIHVSGKQCLIGHVVKNTFYLVFLDGNHRFWKSELKNT